MRKGKKGEEAVNNVTMVIFTIFTCTEFTLAMFLSLRYIHILPTKSFLSSKDTITEAITLLQKFVIQMIMIFGDLDALSGIWSFTVVNVIADLVRNLYFFKTFPLYNFKAMAFQGRLLMILTSINVTCLVACIVRSANEGQVSLKLSLALWIIVSVFLIKLAEEHIQRGFWSIISNPRITDPYLLIHRVTAIKQLRKVTRKSSEYTENFTWTFLANKTLNNENLLTEVLKIDSKFETTEPLDINSRSCSTMLFKYYLERLVELYPENHMVQLFLAQYYVKKIKVYGDAIKICKAIQAEGHINTVLNAELLLIDIQSRIQHNSAKENNPESPFDAVSYIQQQSLLAKLKLQMLDQARLQIKICNEIKRETPNLAVTYENSQALDSLKKKVSRKMKDLLDQISEFHIEPYLLYAHYHRALNHSFNDYTHFLELYLNKSQRSQKYFNQEGLSQKNMFQDNVGFYFLSGAAADAGNIIFASKSGIKGLKDINMLVGTHMSERGPPCLRPIYKAFYKTLAENTPDTYFNKITRGLTYLVEEDYLVEIDYNLTIHPYVTQGFYFCMIFRATNTNKDAMYVHENGDIEAATQNIRRKLKMKHRPVNPKPVHNIKDFSDELALVNGAFNKIALPEKYSKEGFLEKEKIEAIYSTYTNLGKDLYLKPFSSELFLSYNCKVQNQSFGPLLLKVFTFEENTKHYSKAQDSSSPIAHKGCSPMRRGNESSECNMTGYDDEKGISWANLEALTSRKTTRREIVTETARGDNENTSRYPLKQSTTVEQKVEDDFSFNFGDVNEFKVQPRKKAKNSTDIIPDSASTKKKQEERRQEDLENSHILTLNNNSSTTSQRRKLENIYKTSLNTKYHPKIYKIALALFIFMIAVFIVVEVLFLLVTNKNTEELKVKKDILRNFQTRNFLCIVLSGFVRLLWELNFSSLTFTDMGIFPPGIPVYYYLAGDILNQLATTNRNLQGDATLLNESLNGILFTQDISIYSTYFDEEPQVYENLNTFQALDRIMETGLMIVHETDIQKLEVQEKYHFIFRNSLNDLLLKDQFISDKLTALLDSQRELIEGNIVVYLVVKIVVLVGVLGSFIVLFWKQYRKEVRNLSAFCRISNFKMERVLKGCNDFVEDVENHTSFRDNTAILRDEQVKKEVLKRPNKKGIQRKYLLWVAKNMILLAVFSSLTFWSFHLRQKEVNNFQQEQDQIYFIDYMRARTGLSLITSLELFATNGTAFIEDTLALEKYHSLLSELSTIRVETYSVILNSETVENNALINSTIFEDYCEYFEPADVALDCEILKSYGLKTSFISMLNSYQDTLQERYDNYVNSDKTDSALKKAKAKKLDLALATFMVLNDLQFKVADLIEDELSEEIAGYEKERKVVCGGWIGVILVMGYFCWRMVLRRMKESVNCFKNVLKVLPGEVVFSNFVLKTFLIRTTKERVDLS